MSAVQLIFAASFMLVGSVLPDSCDNCAPPPYCPYNQAVDGNSCAVLAGGKCNNQNPCVSGAVCGRKDICVCNLNSVEQPSGLCLTQLSYLNETCTTDYNCVAGLSCINNTCSCPYGTTYKANFQTISSLTYATTTANRCVLPTHARCDPSNELITCYYCSYQNNRCH